MGRSVRRKRKLAVMGQNFGEVKRLLPVSTGEVCPAGGRKIRREYKPLRRVEQSPQGRCKSLVKSPVRSVLPRRVLEAVPQFKE